MLGSEYWCLLNTEAGGSHEMRLNHAKEIKRGFGMDVDIILIQQRQDSRERQVKLP